MSSHWFIFKIFGQFHFLTADVDVACHWLKILQILLFVYLLHQKQPFGAQTYASYILLTSALVKYPSIDQNSVDRSIDRCKKTSLILVIRTEILLACANSNYEFILNITRRR